MSILKAMAMFDKNDGVGRPNTVPSSIFYEDCFPDEPTIIEIHETTLFISGRVTLQDLEEAFVHPFTSITMENCILLGVGILLTDVMQLFPSSLLTLTIIGCPQLSNCACYLLTKGLQEAVLQMDRITKDEITFLNRTNAEFHLILNRPWIHEDWECLALLDHLVELKIQNFGTITFPICLGDCPSLRILTFKNGTLANSRGSLKDSNAPSHFRFLPKTLQQLKLHCLVQSDVLNEVLTHGEFLTLLSLKQSTLGNWHTIARCQQLRCLRVMCHELDVEMIHLVRCLPCLKDLHLSGLLNIADHAKTFRDLGVRVCTAGKHIENGVHFICED